MSTTQGHHAERVAGKYLEQLGFSIVEYNWKKPQCEIDIVAKKGRDIYLVEVKYRKNSDFGGGLQLITKTKLKKMIFAASNWRKYTNWRGAIQLSAVEVEGDNFQVSTFIERLDFA